jgi:regulator of protease activity HflC (stomatin/prohibitin superfamily)
MTELWKAIGTLLRQLQPWQTVRPWEKGLRIRCGRWVCEKGPGFYYKIPFLDEFLIVNTRLRITSTQMYTVRSEDGKPVTLSCKIGYRITNPEAAYRRYQLPDWTVNLIAARAMTQYVAYRLLNKIEPHDLEDFVHLQVEDTGFDIEWVALTDFVDARTYRLLQSVARPGVHGEQGPQKGGVIEY